MLFMLFTNAAFSNVIWQSPVQVSTSPTFDVSSPSLVIDSNGNMTAAWVENNSVVASHLSSGGSWSSPTTLSSTLTASSPILGIDSNGNVTVVWVESSQLKSAALPFGGSWSSVVSVSGIPPLGSVTTPDLAVDAAGNAVAFGS